MCCQIKRDLADRKVLMLEEQKLRWNRCLSETAAIQSDLHGRLSQCDRGEKEECLEGAHVPGRAEQNQGREGGIKGGRDRFLWRVFPQGQKGGSGLLP